MIHLKRITVMCSSMFKFSSYLGNFIFHLNITLNTYPQQIALKLNPCVSSGTQKLMLFKAAAFGPWQFMIMSNFL